MRKLVWYACEGLLVTLLANAVPLTAAAQKAGSTCRTRDATGDMLVNWMLNVLPADDDWAVVNRTTLGLPKTPATDITYVADARICAKVAAAYNAAFNQPTSTVRVMVVVKVGNYFVAEDPSFAPGGRSSGVVLDSRFNLVTRYVS